MRDKGVSAARTEARANLVRREKLVCKECRVLLAMLE